MRFFTFLFAIVALTFYELLSATNDRSYRIILPSVSHSASAKIVDTFPENLDEFTLCYWVRPTNWTNRNSNRAVFSYSVADSPNDILSTMHNNNVTLSRKGKVVSIQLQNTSLASGDWLHVCLTWSEYRGTVHAYAGGNFSGSGILSSKLPPVPLGGEVILGKSRHSNNVDAADCHTCQNWRGDITEIHVWDYVLCDYEILQISGCNSTHEGNILSWSRVSVIPENGAAVKSVRLCELSKCGESRSD